MRRKIFLSILILVILGFGSVYFFRGTPQQPPKTVGNQTISVSPPANKDIASFFDKNKWTLIKSVEGDIDADSVAERVVLLKSIQQTGGGESGDAPGPLYDAGLLVLKGDSIIYNFTPQNDSTRFLMSQKLDIQDVTGDNVPEIVFYCGNQPAADDWFDHAHILQYKTDTKSFVDISLEPFYDSLLHEFTIANFDGEYFSITSDAVYNDPEHDCRSCVAYFKYQVYKWDGKYFIVHQVLDGQKLSSFWGDHPKPDLEYIHSKLKK